MKATLPSESEHKWNDVNRSLVCGMYVSVSTIFVNVMSWAVTAPVSALTNAGMTAKRDLGDMAGTLCPIADVTKPEVVALARWIDSVRSVIPRFILERPPSAELEPDQIDPFDYPKIAPALERLVQENRSDLALRRSEHKRWQMGVILKVSEKSFGTGRMIPITRR